MYRKEKLRHRAGMRDLRECQMKQKRSRRGQSSSIGFGAMTEEALSQVINQILSENRIVYSRASKKVCSSFFNSFQGKLHCSNLIRI